MLSYSWDTSRLSELEKMQFPFLLRYVMVRSKFSWRHKKRSQLVWFRLLEETDIGINDRFLEIENYETACKNIRARENEVFDVVDMEVSGSLELVTAVHWNYESDEVISPWCMHVGVILDFWSLAQQFLCLVRKIFLGTMHLMSKFELASFGFMCGYFV